MADLRCNLLNQLLLQTRYAPEKQRLRQIEACEAVLRLIQPGRQYPFEFVCFHLTGYRPRSEDATEGIDYNTLLHFQLDWKRITASRTHCNKLLENCFLLLIGHYLFLQSRDVHQIFHQ